MAHELHDTLKFLTNKPEIAFQYQDDASTPWSSIAGAHNGVPEAYRAPGKIRFIDQGDGKGIIEYWYKGGIALENLVPRYENLESAAAYVETLEGLKTDVEVLKTETESLKEESLNAAAAVIKGVGNFNAATGVAMVKETGVTFIPSAIATYPNGSYLNVEVAGMTSISGVSVHAEIGSIFISRGTKWDYIPTPDAALSYLLKVVDVAPAVNLVTGINPGYWASTGVSNSSNITSSTALSHTNLIPCKPNEVFAIRNINSFLNSNGKYFDSAGNIVGTNILTAHFIAIPGGFKLVAQSAAGIAFIAFNIDNANSGIIVQSGETLTYETFKVKSDVLPNPSILNLVEEAGYAKTANAVIKNALFDLMPVPPNLAVIESGYWPSQTVSNMSIVTASQSLSHAKPIGCDIGMVFAIKGLTTSLSLSSIGKFFNAAGAQVGSNVTPAALGTIPGGKTVTVPSLAGVAYFGLNITVADVGVSIQLGSEIVTEPKFTTIKPSLLPVSASSVDSLILEAYNRGAALKATTTKKYGILGLGQSNWAGRVDAVDQPADFIAAGRQWANVLFCDNANGTFSPYSLSSSSQFSPELFLYKKLSDYLKTKYNDPTYNLYSVKRALGGTPISEFASGSPSGYWNAFFEKIPSGSILLQEAEIRVRKALELQGANFSIRAVIWHQGESDSTGNAPQAYYTNLRAVISYIRGVLSNPKLPFIIGGINTSSTQYNSVVNLASRKIADEDPYTYYAEVSNGTSTLKSDVLHFNSAGAEELATNIFNIIKDF